MNVFTHNERENFCLVFVAHNERQCRNIHYNSVEVFIELRAKPATTTADVMMNQKYVQQKISIIHERKILFKS